MKLLLVGDPHVTVDAIGDAQKLIDGLLELVATQPIDKVVFMGDLHHNHNLVRIEVTDFWLRNLAKFNGKAVVIVGNHDMSNDASEHAHALQPYAQVGATVVDKPVMLTKDVWAVPYYHSKEELVNTVNKLNPRVLLCHQTFDGSRYENGFYAPDGLDPRLIGCPEVISGHIHTAQVIKWEGGYVNYIGSPRWRSIDDANVDKAVILYDTESPIQTAFYTAKWCSPMGLANVTSVEDLNKLPFKDYPATRYYLDIVGTKDSVEKLSGEAKARYPNAKIRPIYTDRVKNNIHVSERSGIAVALEDYTAQFRPPHGTDIAVLKTLIQQRVKHG